MGVAHITPRRTGLDAFNPLITVVFIPRIAVVVIDTTALDRGSPHIGVAVAPAQESAAFALSLEEICERAA